MQLIGQIELASERGHPHDFVSLGEQGCGGALMVLRELRNSRLQAFHGEQIELATRCDYSLGTCRRQRRQVLLVSVRRSVSAECARVIPSAL